MTVDEIKQNYSMRDVVEMYGLHPNRAGFISCPFHGKDTNPSMKIYKRDYHCFTCGANGDIFTFVQDMENCSFKDAFYKLGGTYEKKTGWRQKRFAHETAQKKESKPIIDERKKSYKRRILRDITMQKLFIKLFPVYSDDWCDSVNQLEKDFAILEKLTREGVKLYE